MDVLEWNCLLLLLSALAQWVQFGALHLHRELTRWLISTWQSGAMHSPCEELGHQMVR